jgi:uncharacterized membrane protein
VHALTHALAGLPPLAIVAVLAIMPIAELRGSIPYGLLAVQPPLPLWQVVGVSIACCWLGAPLSYLALRYLVAGLLRLPRFHALWERLTRRARAHGEHHVGRWGVWGLVLLVALPVPLLGGVYTGTLAAYLLGVRLRQYIWLALIGVAIQAALVTAAVLSGSAAFAWMLKR